MCHAPIGLAPVVCPRCSTRLHADCLAMLRVCPTLGCGTNLPLAKPRRSVARIAAVPAGLSLLALGLLSGFERELRDAHASVPLAPRGGRTRVYPSEGAHGHDTRAYQEVAVGDLDGALADLDKSLQMKPDRIDPLLLRAGVKIIKHDFEGGLADCKRLFELDPAEARAYHYRGCLLYDRRDWKNALADFRRACEVTSTYRDYPHARIWLVRARLGETDAATKELAEYLSARWIQYDWYSKIARFLTDRLSEDEFFKSAASSDAKTEQGQNCQAYFYAGVRRLVEGDKQTARNDLERSIHTNAKSFLEYSSAESELRALDRGD